MDFSSSIEGFATNTLGGAAAGSAVPGVGTLVGGVLGGLGSLIGGLGGDKVGDGKGKFSGLHSSYISPLDDSKITNEDAEKYIRIASRPGVSVEEAAVMMALEIKKYASAGATANSIWDGFSAGTSTIYPNNAQEIRRIIAGEFGASGEYPALVMYDRKPQVITLKGIAASPAPIQTMTSAPAPTSSTVLGQYSQLPYLNAVLGGQSTTGFNLPTTATPPYLSTNSTIGSTTPAATPEDNTTTYALIGGGAVLVLLVVLLLSKK